MINVSDEFKNTMRNRTNFEEEATVTLADGTVLELTAKDFTVTNNYMTEGAGIEQIPIGVAVSKSVQIEIMNDDEHLSVYDYFGAAINLRLKFRLEERSETIQLGRYTVISPATKGETVIISAVDDMWKTNGKYTTDLTYPTTARSVLEEICRKCDLIPADLNFKNNDFQILKAIDNAYTYRAVIGHIAMIAGGNAIMTRDGKLRILSYDFTAFDSLPIINGGTFNPWNNPTSLDGGTFNPWNDGDAADGGAFGDRTSFHMLYQWKELNVCSDDVVITGVKVEYYGVNGEDQSVMEGTEGYVLAVNNPLIAGNEAELAKLLGVALIGATFRKFEGEHIAYPLAEFMDAALIIDRKNNAYKTYITDINFNFCGYTTIKNSAEESLRNGSTYIDDSTQAYIDARKLVATERSERDKAVEYLANQLKNSSGLYMTEEVQDDGSVIYYMHDKPTMKESMVVWKLTAMALGVSTDGGKTFPYGFTVDGDLITKILHAEGIDANYVTIKNLTVGDNVKIGKAGEDRITELTKNTVTTDYINALNVAATSIVSSNGKDKMTMNAGYAHFIKDNVAYGGIGANELIESDTGATYKTISIRNYQDLTVFGYTNPGEAYGRVNYIMNPRGYMLSGGSANHQFSGSALFTGDIRTTKYLYADAVVADKIAIARNGGGAALIDWVYSPELGRYVLCQA